MWTLRPHQIRKPPPASATSSGTRVLLAHVANQGGVIVELARGPSLHVPMLFLHRSARGTQSSPRMLTVCDEKWASSGRKRHTTAKSARTEPRTVRKASRVGRCPTECSPGSFRKSGRLRYAPSSCGHFGEHFSNESLGGYSGTGQPLAIGAHGCTLSVGHIRASA